MTKGHLRDTGRRHTYEDEDLNKREDDDRHERHEEELYQDLRTIAINRNK